MADTKISELVEKATLEDSDYIPGVDNDDPTAVTKKFPGSAFRKIDPVKKELEFNAAAVRAGVSDPASWVSIGMKGAWEFSNNKEDEIVTAINLPKDMDLTEAPILKVCWSSHATSADAVWQLEYLFRQIDEDTTAGAQDTLTQTATSSATADGFTTTDFTGINTISVSDKTMFLSLTRLSLDGNDTLGDTAELHSLIFVYTADKLGEAI